MLAGGSPRAESKARTSNFFGVDYNKCCEDLLFFSSFLFNQPWMFWGIKFGITERPYWCFEDLFRMFLYYKHTHL